MRLLSVPSLDLGIMPILWPMGLVYPLIALFLLRLLCFLTQGHRQNSFLG